MNYYNLVFVNHCDGGKNYLYKAPLNINLNRFEKVYVNSIKGESVGMCVSNNFIVSEDIADQIINGTGAYEPLKEVVGYAKPYTDYNLERFDLGSRAIRALSCL